MTHQQFDTPVKEAPMAAFCAVGICLLASASFPRAESEQPLLIRHPTLSRDKIAFCYAGDIWTVGRDGGDATRLTGLKGDWEVENRGITPDIEVEMDQALVRQGHDPQLEKAVEVIVDQLKKNPLPTYKRPEYPNYHQALPK
jgi:hypothetical protein